MNTILTNLSELVKMVTDSFRLPAVFPALFFIIINSIFIIPNFKFLPIVTEIMRLDLKEKALLTGGFAILLGYVLSALEVSIVRLYEGYTWKESFWGQLGAGWQKGYIKWLKDQKYDYNKKAQKRYRQLLPKEVEEDFYYQLVITKSKDYETELQTSFPPNPARVLPTKLGNVIASFESYPGQKYGMDGVTFWSRMFPVWEQKGFLPYVTEPRATVDFLLNMSLLLAAFGVECILLRVLFLSSLSWVLPAIAFLLAVIFYKTAIISAYNWGEMFCAGFDLFRYHLAEMLGLKPMDSFQKEKSMWKSLTELWNVYSDKSFEHFNYTEEAWPTTMQNKGDENV